MSVFTTKLPIWNPFLAGYRENPYEHLRILREHNPIHKGINGRWMLLRYDDVKGVLGDPRFRTVKLHEQLAAKQALIRGPESNLSGLCASVEKWLFFLDPPEHTELRKVVVKIWNQYKVRAYIEEVTAEAVDTLRQKPEADIVTDFAVTIPMKVISRILGLPAQDYGKLRQWSNRFAYALEPFNSLYHLQNLNTTAREFYQYMEGIVAEKRRRPDDTFLSNFLIANDELSQPLTPAEIVSVFIVLFFAGIETSIYLFGQSVLHLIQYPQQAEALRQNPALIKTAVEEFIRFASPLQYTLRVASENMAIDGVMIRENEIVHLSVASANRDPSEFPNPESLELNRQANAHLSFGHSFHHCIGARLAREELQVAIGQFVQHFPAVRLNPRRPHQWENLIINRGLHSLPVLLT